ncbi:MAG: Crp/Fnr family transcriptional regulator [Janthinobacterium lividum]
MHTFRTYIEECTCAPISDADFAVVAGAFTPKKVKRRHYLLQEGEICKHFAFVVRGALRLYTVDEKGVEHITRFAVENRWIGDRESYVQLTPSAYSIDSLEDSEVLLITNTQVQELIQTVPAIAQLARALDQRAYIASQKRLHTFIACTAEERYTEFLAKYPDYLRRFPQHMIASYLGISPETLSRIRTKHLRPKTYCPPLETLAVLKPA